MTHGVGERWWESRAFLLALVFVSALPLLWPDVAPLVDLPGHMGRYRVQLDLATSPDLQQYYGFDWRLIGNLGVDLLVVILEPLFGLEASVKLVVLSIPMLTAGGLLWVAREVHGRMPPTAMLAVPFAYNYPFLFGFVNFALAMGLALCAFALWLRLARLGHLRMRAALFLPISVLLWVVHAFGWGTLGVLAFSAELVRQHDNGRNFVAAAFSAGIHCLSLIPPVALMLLWRSEAGGLTGDWFNWAAKGQWLYMALRDRWQWFDVMSLALCIGVGVWALADRRTTWSRNLAASFLFLLLVFILLPRIVFGSAYADMRLAPYLFAIGLVAIRFRETTSPALMRAIAMGALAFVAIRTGATGVSMWLYDRTYDRELAALDHIPQGARLVSFTGRECVEPWAMTRLLHLPAMATVRHNAFSNDQWTMAGAQLLSVRYKPGWPFDRDASQVVTLRRCPYEVWRTIDQALATFPRDAFDYVWLISPPPFDPALARGLQPVWRDGSSVLYRVVNSNPPAPKDRE